MQRLLIPLLALAVIFGFLFWKFGPSSQDKAPQGPITITYWGFWDESLINPIIDDFEKVHPEIKINYQKQNLVNYRTRVQTQIFQGSGPDVFEIHNSWTPMFDGYLAASPDNILGFRDVQRVFYPVVEDSFVKNQQVYGVPTMIDGIALYVNTDILAAAGVAVPNNWKDFWEGAVKMTVKDQSGQIKTAGAAMGVPGNVDNWSEILGLLMLQQPGVDIQNPISPEAVDVLKFYTGFVTDPTKKTWDSSMAQSGQAFINGHLAYYFGTFSKAAEFKQQNPSLKFKVVPVPQLPDKQVAWASFWGEAVSSQSKHIKESWTFVQFLTSEHGQQLFAGENQKLTGIGWPYSRPKLNQDLVNDPIVNAFVAQGPIYKFWYLNSSTGDFGLNDGMVKYFAESVNNNLGGEDPNQSLQRLPPQINDILNQFARHAPTPSGKSK